MHLGGMTTEALVRWATSEGATAAAGRGLARSLVASWAGRAVESRASAELTRRAAATFARDLPPVDVQIDPDGTRRLAVRLADGAIVETVAIPHPHRTTVCLSTQVGCARGCVFCASGRLGLVRNLTAAEITCQFAVAARHLRNAGCPTPGNVVFMGMGEPLDNLHAVLRAADVLSDDNGFAVAARRITVSTVGVVPRMLEFYAHGRYRLAVSLHALDADERRALLPVSRTWDLGALRAAIAASPRTILLQWTLIADRNDSLRHARDLAAFTRELDVRVNLIPLNPGPEDTLRAPPMEAVRAFQRKLLDAGVRTLVRMPHGQAVGGACGQLSGARRN